jgi:segregation and condensation protein B
MNGEMEEIDNAVTEPSLETQPEDEGDSGEDVGVESFALTDSELAAAQDEDLTASVGELKAVIEALLFVAEEPLPVKQLCKVMGGIAESDVTSSLGELQSEYEARGSGLEIREIANGWRISTRPQFHDFIRKYLKTRPSARLSLPALETLAVIAYKQPITNS